MADLFDMKVGGLGFHVTAHMIAIAALFVACFAITGYITFRDGSISEKKLDGANFLTEGEAHDAVVSSVSHPGDYQEKWYSQTYTATTMNVTRNANDSLGVIATGFTLGHVATEAYIHVSTGTTGDLVNLDFELGTLDSCAYGEAPSSGATMTGCSAIGATTAAVADAGPLLTNNMFTVANNTICLIASATTASGTAGEIRVSVRVVSPPGAPALP